MGKYYYSFLTGYFSSQIFNEPYRSKLAQLDAVVKSAVEECELLPGLVMAEETDEYPMTVYAQPSLFCIHIDTDILTEISRACN